MTRHLFRYRTAAWLSRTLPRRVAFVIGEWVAEIHCRMAASDRRAIQANLTALLGLSVTERSPMVREVFRNFARYLVEFFRAASGVPPIVHVQGREHLDRIVRAGRGGIVLSAHVGNWELGGMAIRRQGWPFRAVALRHAHPDVNALFDRQRLRYGFAVIPLGAAATRACLERLRHGELIGILGDREFGSNGLHARLFNRPALLPKGPAILSLRTGAPVVPVFMIREAPWQFRLFIEPPIWPSGQVQELTQTYAGVIERYLRQFPTQWLMFREFALR